jgi:hypothetical protein
MARLAPCRRSGIAKHWDDPGSAAQRLLALRCAREKRRNGILNPGKVL